MGNFLENYNGKYIEKNVLRQTLSNTQTDLSLPRLLH